MAIARVRINPLSSNEIEIEYSSDQKISEIVSKVLSENNLPEDVSEYMEVLINGYKIDRELWGYTKIKEGQSVLVASTPKGGSFGETLKTIAVIAVTYYTAGAMSGPSGAFLTAAASIGTTLILNSLIPPPVPGGGSLGASSTSFEGSQMYTVTSQSNSVKKYGSVPKVYGRHRIFPTVAANPYTEIEADDETGDLVQFFYAVYDFGFGPINVSDIRIGDTAITDYADIQYSLVDFNKPKIEIVNELAKVISIDNINNIVEIDQDFITSPEKFYQMAFRNIDGSVNLSNINITGLRTAKILSFSELPLVGEYVSWGESGLVQLSTRWDDEYLDSLSFYKGDVEQEDFGVSINGNKFDGVDEDEYQIIRNASDKGDGDEQEITLNFICPKGLNSFATNGNRGTATVELLLSFAEEGTENWTSFNDGDFVNKYEITGASNDGTYIVEATIPFIFNRVNRSLFGLSELSSREVTYSELPPNTAHEFDSVEEFDYRQGLQIWDIARDYIFTNKRYGIKSGEKVFYTKNQLNPTAIIEINGVLIGSINSSIADGSYYKNTLDLPVDSDVVVTSGYTYEGRDGFVTHTDSQFMVGNYRWVEETVGNYIFIHIAGDGRFVTMSPGLSSLSKTLSAGKVRITANSTEQVYATVKLTPKVSKNYKLKIERINSTSEYSYQTTNDLALLNVVTRFDRNPIETKKRHVFLELKIRATNQLSGSIQNLSATCESILPVWNNDLSIWEDRPTRNPAWVYADLLTGQINKKPISKERLDISSIYTWSQFCNEVPVAPSNIPAYISPRFQCDFVLDFETTLQSLINQVASASQASLNIIDGKYGVLVDKLQTIPIQVFTPRNSWNFSSSRNYFESPHALRIKYIDIGLDWDFTELIVYDDGYDVNNSTEFDDLETFAVTNSEQAWRFGRYMIAQSRLRQESITIDVDFEHLVCTRGDYVIITQDVMRVGGTPARVKTVSGNRVTIDDKFETIPAVSYGYTFRNSLGQVFTNTMTVIDSVTADFDGDIPSVGDLVIWGEVGKVSFDCLVKSITPNSDMSASLLLTEKADAVYDAESSDTIPDYDPNITLNSDSELSAPGVVRNLSVDENTYMCTGSGYEYYIQLSWNVPEGSAYDVFEIYVDKGTGFNLSDYSNKGSYKYIVEDLGIEHKFKVLAVSSTGKKISLTEAFEAVTTPLEKSAPPSDVESIDLNITGEVLQISWTRVTDCDASEYLIRYNPTINGTWEASIPLLRVSKDTSMSSMQARTGTYLIKAIDFNGNESDVAAKAITSIPDLFNLNIIEETNDFPVLPGSLNQVVKTSGELKLQEISNGDPLVTEYHSDGYYYYADFLDLGEIYTVRLQSLIQAEGFTEDDIMANWVTLDDVLFMSNAKQSEWDVRTEVRYTDSLNVMSEWVTMDSVDPISEGQQDSWSVWKDVNIGDFTARIFQFRLKLISNKVSVTPRVIDGIIKADMPDRVFDLGDIVIPINGKTIDLIPWFKGPSNLKIKITQDNAHSGDYHKITNKTLKSFDIEMFDTNDISVQRTIDIQVKGYGYNNDQVI